VLVTGEVRFPGRYTLVTRDERLSSVIRRAGGLTPQADANGAYFSRVVDSTITRQLKRAEVLRQRDSSEAEDVFSDSALRAEMDTTTIDEVSDRIRVGIDLREALRGRDGSDDLLLVNGDSIHLPPFRQTVSVRGAVNMPTALAHSGNRLDYYLNAAGGPTERARARRAYVIQPNGKIESRRHLLWIFRMDPKPLPGAAVVVPERVDQPSAASTLATLSVVTQMLASLAAIIAISR
jgi:protein involved in polysaccharide export with SLBB domain